MNWSMMNKFWVPKTPNNLWERMLQTEVTTDQRKAHQKVFQQAECFCSFLPTTFVAAEWPPDRDKMQNTCPNGYYMLEFSLRSPCLLDLLLSPLCREVRKVRKFY
jgi:hypothetical protein